MRAPEHIAIDRKARSVEITWDDGALLRLSHFALRMACACAHCKAAIMQGQPITIDPDIIITTAAPVGQYGIQFNFSDGHERGIYPWEFLRTLNSA